MGKPKYQASELELRHVAAFADAFLMPRYRERLRARPRDLYEVFCHGLPERWRTECAVQTPRSVKELGFITRVLSAASESPVGVYLGSWSGVEVGEYPIGDAVSLAWRCGGSVVSVEPGEVAYFVPEVGDQYFLVRDANRRAKVVQALSRSH